jgi:hypothetical protein
MNLSFVEYEDRIGGVRRRGTYPDLSEETEIKKINDLVKAQVDPLSECFNTREGDLGGVRVPRLRTPPRKLPNIRRIDMSSNCKVPPRTRLEVRN